MPDARAKGKLAGLVGRIPPYETLNPLSVAFSFALPATLGTGISVWYHACYAWGLFELFVRRRVGWSRDRAMWIVAGCLSLFAAVNLAGYLVNGVDGGENRLIPLLTLLGLPVLYSVLAHSRKEAVALAAVGGSALAAYVAAGAALYQAYHGNPRAEGLTGNALVFGHTTTLAGGLCLAGLLLGYGNRHGLRLQGVLAGGFGAAVVALVLSGSRAYWAVFVLTTVGTLLFCRSGDWKPGRRGALAGLAAAVALGAFAFEPVSRRVAALERDWRNLSVEGRYDTSLGFRLKLWELGGTLAREHPWIGHGVPSSRALIEEGFKGAPELRQGFTHFHNGFLSAAVEAGAIGLAALLAALATLAVAAFRALRDGASPAQRLGGGMLAILVTASVISGSFTILIGHDILDATFMSWALTGLFLACGTPAAGDGGTTNHVALS